MGILVLGTVALDDVKTPYGARKNMLGGSAVHFSMSARIFTKVSLVAAIGRDFPLRYMNFLRRMGFDISAVTRQEGKSFQWRGKYDADLNTAITLDTQLGVLLNFKPRISREQRRIKNVFLANVDPEIQKYLLARMVSPGLVGMDSMNYWIANKRRSLLEVLKKVNIYLVNEQEARSLSGEHNLIKAAKFLLRAGPEIVVIKKGEHGSLFLSRGIKFCLPAYPAEKVVDPTGAGDTFAGAFMGYLSKRGRISAPSLKQAVLYGTIAASFNVEGFGMEKTARLSYSSLKQRLREFRKLVLF